jgi:hypothetical protein
VFKKLSMFWALIALVSAAATGCGGDNESPVEPTPICSVTISPATLSFGSGGGSGTVTVTAPQGCPWTAAAAPTWITVTSGSSGSSAGTVGYSVAANTGSESRTSTLSIGGQTHTVVQDGRAPTTCSYQIAPGNAVYNKDAASGTFAVTAPASCAWTAVSNASWLTVVAGAQGSGNGTVGYAVARNIDTAERSGVITAAGQSFAVRQTGDAGACAYAVTPVAFQPCMPRGTLNATLTTQASCPWTVTSDSAWLAVASSASGSGSSAISMTYSDNYDAPRAGTVMVRWPTPTEGQNIHVTQAGCLYAVSRTEISMAAAGGLASFDVIQQSEPNTCGGATQDRCVWTAQADVPWITIAGSMPRSGDNPVSFTVAANDGPSIRVGRIAVRDKIVVVTQSGR